MLDAKKLPYVKAYSALLNDSRIDKLGAILYGLIEALSYKEGYCSASNNFLGTLLGYDKRTISRTVNNLKQYGYIQVFEVYKPSTKCLDQRKIKPLAPLDKIVYIPRQNEVEGVDENVYTGIDKNVLPPLDKNVYVNKSINNKSKLEYINIYSEVINSFKLNEDVKKVLYDYIAMRDFIRSPITTAALQLEINKLISLSVKPLEQKKIIENSISKNWKGFYPLSEDDKKLLNEQKQKESKKEIITYGEDQFDIGEW